MALLEPFKWSNCWIIWFLNLVHPTGFSILNGICPLLVFLSLVLSSELLILRCMIVSNSPLYYVNYTINSPIWLVLKDTFGRSILSVILGWKPPALSTKAPHMLDCLICSSIHTSSHWASYTLGGNICIFLFISTLRLVLYHITHQLVCSGIGY